MKTTLSLLLLLFGVNFAQVQAEEPNPKLNFMNAQLAEQLLNQTMALSDPQLIQAQANLLRQHYLALIESGFSKDEALQIVIALASRDKN